MLNAITSVKMLGIYLYADYSWNSHIEATISKATQRLYFLKQLKRAGVPEAQLLHFYTVVIRPVLEYVAPVWNHMLTKTQTDQTEAIQWRALRIIYSYISDMSYTKALYCAAVPSLADCPEHFACKFFKSVLEPSSCFSPFTYSTGSLYHNLTKICKQVPSHPPCNRKYQTFISYGLSHYQPGHSKCFLFLSHYINIMCFIQTLYIYILYCYFVSCSCVLLVDLVL